MSAHERSLGATDEYYTPRFVFEALGVTFDLDVAHPGLDRWPAFAARAVISENSLETPWRGFVWMNPPFGRRMGLEPWLAKFLAHGDGVALTPDRTSAPWWIRTASQADGLLVVGKADPPRGAPNKIAFHRPDGSQAERPRTGTTLFAVGGRGFAALRNAERAGLGLLLVRGDA